MAVGGQRMTVSAESARLSAASGDPAWEARYNADVPRLDAAIAEAISLAKSLETKRALARTAQSNAQLIALEAASFEATRGGRDVEADLDQ